MILCIESPCHTLPEQNGATEQENSTDVESTRSMLHTSGLPKELWAEACNTAVYILNHTGPTPVEHKMPLELWSVSCATIGHLRVFGPEYYVHIPKQKRHKWDQKCRLGRLVGYMGEKDGYRIWIPNERKIMLSRDVLFKPEVTCNLRSNFIQTESVCPRTHVVPTQEIQIIQDHERDDKEKTSTFGGSGGSKSERHIQDRKNVRERKQPNWMTSGEFVCLAGNSHEDY